MDTIRVEGLSENIIIKDISYELEDIKLWDNKISYCKGKVTYNGGLKVKKSFFFHDECDSAREMFSLSSKVIHDFVLRPWFYTAFIDKDNNKKFVVCYDDFDDFLDAYDFKSDPIHVEPVTNLPKYYLDPHTLHPHKNVQTTIQGLLSGIMHMHAKLVSSNLLDKVNCYVTCGSMVKIFRVNITRDMFVGDDTWNKSKDSDIKKFKTILDKKVLPSNWSVKLIFLRCFDLPVPTPEDRLSMAINHPFLKTNKLDILYLILKVHQDFSVKPTKVVTCGRFVSKAFVGSFVRFVASRTYPVIQSSKTPNWLGNVDKTGIVRNFLAQGVPGGNLNNIQGTGDLKTLIRLLRNLVVHYSDPNHNLDLDLVYQEIRRTWPLLIPCIYELMYVTNTSLYHA